MACRGIKVTGTFSGLVSKEIRSALDPRPGTKGFSPVASCDGMPKITPGSFDCLHFYLY